MLVYRSVIPSRVSPGGPRHTCPWRSWVWGLNKICRGLDGKHEVFTHPPRPNEKNKYPNLWCLYVSLGPGQDLRFFTTLYTTWSKTPSFLKVLVKICKDPFCGLKISGSLRLGWVFQWLFTATKGLVPWAWELSSFGHEAACVKGTMEDGHI